VNLAWKLELIGKLYAIDISSAPSVEAKLELLVTQLAASTNNKVVILVDEYDYPILTHLHTIEIAQAQQAILRSFYTVIKSLDQFLRFVLLTGVSTFSRTSIFSGLNNLKDISNSSEGTTLLGYTQGELEQYFSDYIGHIASAKKSDFKSILNELLLWYNGYRFSQEKGTVYNPYSIFLYLDSGIFANYWFETGTPSFLINILRQKRQSIENIVKGKISVTSLGTFNIENIPLITIILFQTGYLTIKEYNVKTHTYKLGLPNREVKISFYKHLLSVFTYLDEPDVESHIVQIREALETNNIDGFFSQLKSLFAHVSYHLHINQEKYYHSLFQCMGTLLDFSIQLEIATDKGRIDLTLVTKRYIYLFELKFNQSSMVALEQIENKKYYEKYLDGNKKVVLIGVSFSQGKHGLKIDHRVRQL
jgi:Predicted AAA-ATPase/PD-(D/E)XK nuclease superfamily